MTNSKLIQGLLILENYYEDGEYNNGAEHDIIYAYCTDSPVSKEHVEKLVELGWLQEDVLFGEGDYEAKNYDPDECWMFYV